MEEARQHPAVTTADWLAIGGKAVGLLCAIAMLLSLPMVGGSFVEPLAAVFCLAGVFVLSVRLAEGLVLRRLRWRDYIYRGEKPVAFWRATIATACALILYGAGFLFIIDVI